VKRYNTGRLRSAIGYVTPLEAEEVFYAKMNDLDKAA
jgi:putative transposase